VHRPRPGVRLRDIADRLSITERSAHGIVTDLAEAGYRALAADAPRSGHAAFAPEIAG
jgi:Mn-dependent DtxR family transcriptional regulator